MVESVYIEKGKDMYTKTITVLTLKELTALISDYVQKDIDLSTSDYNPNSKILSINFNEREIELSVSILEYCNWMTYYEALVYLAHSGVLSFGEYQIIDD